MEGHTVKNSKSKYLVIDTAGFIRNAPLESFGQNLITLHEVIDEIRDKETKQRLKALPFELQFLEPDTDSISKGTFKII
jgi:RNA-binding protein NOB1